MADDFAQTVKQQVDIVRIVGEYMKLRKTGAQNYTGLCPFHKEKTGSFSVNATHGFFYCFGCHEKGDVFTFVMKMETISFPEAVRVVAGKAGIPLPKRDFSSPQEAEEAGLRRQLIDLHEAATQYFEAQLKAAGAARAREYLSGRGVATETLTKFRIGYAPDDFNMMRERLQPHFAEEALRASGLFSSKEQEDGSAGPMYARFRKRITFPIANEQGKPIAFTARALEDVDDKGRPVAKYLNSPETLLYTKGNVLFNLDKAKADMRANDFALLVEGQMDCISVYTAGVKNVLATSGTAFTEAQVRLLGRFTKRVVVNFDPDTAGAAAADKSIKLLTGEGFEVKVVALEDGLDPDRYVRERGIQAYLSALRNAKRLIEYRIERARTLYPGRTAEAKVKQLNFLLPDLRNTPNRIQRDEFAEEAAQKLGIDSAMLRQEFKQAAAQRLERVKREAQSLSGAERVLLRALIQPEHDLDRIAAVDRLSANPDWYEGLAAGSLLDTLAKGPAPGNPLDVATSNDSRSLIAETLHMPQDLSRTSEPVHQLALEELQRQGMERRKRELRVACSDAQRLGDDAKVTQLSAEISVLDRALRLLVDS